MNAPFCRSAYQELVGGQSELQRKVALAKLWRKREKAFHEATRESVLAEQVTSQTVKLMQEAGGTYRDAKEVLDFFVVCFMSAFRVLAHKEQDLEAQVAGTSSGDSNSFLEKLALPAGLEIEIEGRVFWLRYDPDGEVLHSTIELEGVEADFAECLREKAGENNITVSFGQLNDNLKIDATLQIGNILSIPRMFKDEESLKNFIMSKS